MMLAADRSHVVAATYTGALRGSAYACLAGQVVTIVCNLFMVRCLGGRGAPQRCQLTHLSTMHLYPQLLYFGGEVADMRRSHNDDKSPGMLSAELTSSSALPGGPTFRQNDSTISGAFQSVSSDNTFRSANPFQSA